MGATTLKTRIHTAALVAATVMAMGALAACSGQSAPIVTTTPSASPTATTSPSPSPSASPTPLTDAEALAMIPENAREENFVSAALFARYFLEQYHGMFENPQRNVALLSHLSSPECNYCADALSRARESAKIGAYTDGGQISWPESAGAAQGGPRDDGKWYVNQRYKTTAGATYLGDGTLYSEAQPMSGIVGVRLSWRTDHWMISGVEFVPDDH